MASLKKKRSGYPVTIKKLKTQYASLQRNIGKAKQFETDEIDTKTQERKPEFGPSGITSLKKARDGLEPGHEKEHEIRHERGHESGHEIRHEIGHEIRHEIGHDIKREPGREVKHEARHSPQGQMERSKNAPSHSPQHLNEFEIVKSIKDLQAGCANE